MSNYDNSPYIKINGYDNDAYSGYAQIDKKIKESLGNKKIVVVDCYLGINDRELLNVLIKKLTPLTRSSVRFTCIISVNFLPS